MITIISATNRPDNNTLKIANNYFRMMQEKGADPRLLSLENLPHDIAFMEVYGKRTPEFQQILDQYIIPASKFVIISPEYNGSFPGILKVFFDAIHPDTNRNKKVALIGVSTGRAGNLRGMDHLTAILNYLGMHVHPNKLPISQVLNLMDADGNLKDAYTIKVLEKQISEFMAW